MGEKTRDEIAFIVFLLHALADAWHKSVLDTFRLLQESEIMRSYIIPCCDALHCLDQEYLVDDITTFAREKGYAI